MKNSCECCSSNSLGLFCGLNEETLSHLNANQRLITFAKGQIVFEEGSEATGLYSVHSGKIKIIKTNSDGKEAISQIISKGDLIGHWNLFEESRYSTTAVALENCKISFLEKNFTLQAILNYPDLASRLILKLNLEMKKSEMRLNSLMNETSQRD